MDIINKVKKDYNTISKHFSETRTKPWPEMKTFLGFLKPCNKILDIGCGNGRFFKYIKDENYNYTGIDISDELIKIAKEKHPDGKFEAKNILDIKYENSFDAVCLFAMFHHLDTVENRKHAIKILHKSLKKDGILFITTWNIYNKRRIKFFFKSCLSFLLGRNNSIKDSLIPWKNQKGEVVNHRYYYAFTLNELKHLFKENSFEIIKCELTPEGSGYFDARNLLIVLRKK